MQTDIRNESMKGGFVDLFNLFSDEESKEQGIHTFEFNEEDIMRSELVKFLISKIKEL
jgi:hypothetical protein